jgi:hypothetical protein
LHFRLRISALDPWLAVVLVAAAVFCLYGAHWGRVECWNPDQMALRHLRGWRPGSYAKPPFQTYLNKIVVLTPIEKAEAIADHFSGHKVRFAEARLLGSRLLVTALFLGTIALIYAISLQFYGRFAARILAAIVGTSAGFISYAHFLTADSPLLFWMVAAFYFAQRIIYSGTTRDYVLAGLLTGLATATKYNGLGVGIAIVAAHFLARRPVVSPRLLLGLAMVLIGFVVGNPYAVLDRETFVADFMYNYIVTPRYEGQTGVGYDDFLRRIPEIIGEPAAWLWPLCCIGALAVVVLRGGENTRARQGFILAASVSLLYYLKIGGFPRMPTRFVLPAVPFLLLMTGAFLAWSEQGRRWVYLLVAPLLAYNAICSAWVGKRFASDPRLRAQEWVLQNVAAGEHIESSPSSPHWAKLPSLNAIELRLDRTSKRRARPGQVVDTRLPVFNGRAELFSQLFPGNSWVEQRRLREGVPDDSIFTPESLATRNPDVITIHVRDTTSPNTRVQSYYRELLDEKTGYRVAFHGTTPPAPRFVYPRTIDFLSARITILQRANTQNGALIR